MLDDEWRSLVDLRRSGALGDEMDLLEWFSLCELRTELLVKLSKLEESL